jgi:UDP-3-O-[3-hydroxymyristoyl] glucosamine N-acyltransferase
MEKMYKKVGTNKVHKTALIYDNVVLGENNIIGAYTVIGSPAHVRNTDPFSYTGKIYIGNNNHITDHCIILQGQDKDTHIGSNNFIMSRVMIGGVVTIKDNCEIGAGTLIGGYVTIGNNAKIKLGCNIRNRVQIGNDCIIGMGAIVVKNIDSESLNYGCPSKKIKSLCL